MTPQERAEKIVEKARKMNVELGGPVLFSMIAVEIQAAVDEAVKHAVLHMSNNEGIAIARAEAVEEARKQWDAELEQSTRTLAQMFTKQLRDEALEEAAKLADKHSNDFPGNIEASLVGLRTRDEIQALQNV